MESNQHFEKHHLLAMPWAPGLIEKKTKVAEGRSILNSVYKSILNEELDFDAKVNVLNFMHRIVHSRNESTTTPEQFFETLRLAGCTDEQIAMVKLHLCNLTPGDKKRREIVSKAWLAQGIRSSRDANKTREDALQSFLDSFQPTKQSARQVLRYVRASRKQRLEIKPKLKHLDKETLAELDKLIKIYHYCERDLIELLGADLDLIY
ncbi:hypothetical protein ACFL3T_03625 [Patescibacteria group bacterium]